LAAGREKVRMSMIFSGQQSKPRFDEDLFMEKPPET
jgi:hypothetical protein